jgi:hypothetical protein
MVIILSIVGLLVAVYLWGWVAEVKVQRARRRLQWLKDRWDRNDRAFEELTAKVTRLEEWLAARDGKQRRTGTYNGRPRGSS